LNEGIDKHIRSRRNCRCLVNEVFKVAERVTLHFPGDSIPYTLYQSLPSRGHYPAFPRRVTVRVQRLISDYIASGDAPPPAQRRRPRAITDLIVDFSNVRTMQAVPVSASPRVDAIRERFHADVTARSISNIPTEPHIGQRVAFCDK
jgi:hypothetical protein